MEAALEEVRRDLPRLAREVADDCHRELEGYRRVSDEAVGIATQRNMAAAMRALRRGGPDSNDMAEVASTVNERHAAGIPRDELIRGFALCIWRFHQRYLEACAHRVPAKETIAGSNILWWLGDTITSTVVTVYGQLDMRKELLDLEQHASFVRRLLTGRASPSQLRAALLDPDSVYQAARCIPLNGFTQADHDQLEASGSSTDQRAVLALVNGEILGVFARVPQASPGCIVALGPAMPLADMARSFDVADRVAHVASYLGLIGVHTLEDLSWRVAAVDEPELAESMRRRYLDTLRAAGAFGKDLEISVRSYFRHDMNLARAAGDLNLHVNTLRYRLRRFCEITGADLSTPSGQLDAIWAFQLGDLPAWFPCL